MNTPIRYGPHDKYVEVWGVQSESRPDKVYTVARTAADIWSCACPRWTLNAKRPECKHIQFVKNHPSRRGGFAPIAETPEQVKKALSRFAMLDV